MSKFSNSLDDKRIKMVEYLNVVVVNEILSKKIEQSVYNYVIQISKEKNIQRRWANPVFLKLYNSKIISIYSNLKKDSYIQNETFLERIEKGEIDSRHRQIFLNEKGKKLFEEIFLEQKKRIYNALKNSDSDSVIKFKNVLKKIVNE